MYLLKAHLLLYLKVDNEKEISNNNIKFGLTTFIYLKHWTTIVQFYHLHSGHTLPPAHAYKLDLNDAPFCTWHLTDSLWYRHILFNCPFLHIKHTFLFKSLKTLRPVSHGCVLCVRVFSLYWLSSYAPLQQRHVLLANMVHMNLTNIN